MIDVRLAYWSEQSDRRALKAIRYAVFVDEQRVPEAEEMDAFDETSVHLLASCGEPNFIGCARIMPSGQIGQMAVLKNFRGRGVGSRLMQAAITQAKQQPFREPVSARSMPCRKLLSPVWLYRLRRGF